MKGNRQGREDNHLDNRIKLMNERERERKVILSQIRSHGEYVHMEYTYTWRS